jgi:putative methyltransferase
VTQPPANTSRDWSDWHRAYDDPTSRLSRRLAVVQRHLREAIDARPGPMRIISMCAGEGRDVIPVLADHPRRNDITARLIELDPRNADVARTAIHAANLDLVEIIDADAATTDSYAGAVPADIVLACGVFGNISDDDIRNTIEHLPTLCAPKATVLWTRGWHPDHDVTPLIREWFKQNGFEELAFEAPEEFHYSVGVHRLTAPPRPFEPGVTLFQFRR